MRLADAWLARHQDHSGQIAVGRIHDPEHSLELSVGADQRRVFGAFECQLAEPREKAATPLPRRPRRRVR